MARKITATSKTGETLSRRTDRVYTHAVISRGRNASAIEGSLRNERARAQTQIADYTATIEKQGHDNWIFSYDMTQIEEHAYTKWIEQLQPAAAWTDEDIARLAAERTAAAERGATWHTRLDLAQKEYAKRVGEDQDVELVEVNS